jgi:glycerol-3-phosphate dehydrogenase
LGFVRRRPAEVAGEKFDVVVIGGGINGAGIAREAALAGYRTLLVERLDFGGGTTSRATRLIHGGLRYLEHGELGLVHESLADREDLVRTAPHLVRPLRLLVPVYAGDARPAWKIRAGLALYDALSFRKSLPRHRAVARRDIDRDAPGLNRGGLRAAYTFYDAQVQFPERLAIEAVRDLTDAGGVALNHTSCVGLVSPAHVLSGVKLRDEISGETFAVEAKVAVNAAGPWVDEVLAGSDAERHEPLIGGTKGSHLVVEWPGAPKQAIFATAKQDGRPFFILPWYRYTLIGTTDVRYDGDPSAARCTVDELRYLIDEATRLFPASPLMKEQVLYTYSGVRPLPYAPGRDESSITRSHFIVDHVKRGGPTGLLSIVGGKLTTYRSLSRLTLRAIGKHVAPSGAVVRAAADAGGWTLEAGGATSDPLALYGPRADEVRALIDADAALGVPICEHNPEVLAQVAYAVEREDAATLGDVLLRRLPCGWSACHGLDGAERVAGIMAERLGWDEARGVVEVASYRREVAETLVPVSAIEDAATVWR